jgi:competence ComEA-like helix-hairpin-helix protein
MAALALWTAGAQDSSDLPKGAGRELVERICTSCHELDQVTSSRNTAAGWEKIVDNMIMRGAEGTDHEFETIIQYLAANFGKDAPLPKIKINKASATELASSLAIPNDTASAIVTYREKNGPFKEWADLKKVPGLDLKEIEDKKDRLEYAEKEPDN